MVKTLVRNRFDNFDSFDEDQKEHIVQQVINHLCHYNGLPHDLKNEIFDSLYSILLNKWEEVVEKEQEIIDNVFIQYFPDLSKDELITLVDNYITQIPFKSRRLKLMSGRMKSVEVETHQIERVIQTMHKQIESQWDNEQETME